MDLISIWPCCSVGKEFACNSGDPGSTTRLGRSLGEENGNPLQYSCLKNPRDRGTYIKSLILIHCDNLSPWLSHPVLLPNQSFLNDKVKLLS